MDLRLKSPKSILFIINQIISLSIYRLKVDIYGSQGACPKEGRRDFQKNTESFLKNNWTTPRDKTMSFIMQSLDLWSDPVKASLLTRSVARLKFLLQWIDADKKKRKKPRQPAQRTKEMHCGPSPHSLASQTAPAHTGPPLGASVSEFLQAGCLLSLPFPSW